MGGRSVSLVAVVIVLLVSCEKVRAKSSFGRSATWVPSPSLSLHRRSASGLWGLRREHTQHGVDGATILGTRGGASVNVDVDVDTNIEDEEAAKERAEQRRVEREKEIKYQMEQHVLLQLRSTLLSETLAARGLSVTTMTDVTTPAGDKPPQLTDWDCALSTHEEPKTCLYSFDAEPNTKVVAPMGSDQWISLVALNRLRRTDPSKVEPMWHSRYAILRSWFSDSSEFSVSQHVGWEGFVVGSLLLDSPMVLRAILVTCTAMALITVLPLLEFMVNRLIVSGLFWSKWKTWSRFVHAALPLKLLIGQMTWKFVTGSYITLETFVREYIVEMECSLLQDSMPLTVGPGSILDEDDAERFPDEDGEEEQAFDIVRSDNELDLEEEEELFVEEEDIDESEDDESDEYDW
eukprot:scaffold45539_cov51-Attheya_sp.AAC.4